ncbi:unnamed protein product [Dicrocoelium dendriticum]|nr:unnamed protein product [Dicrocoelium dendriticum]
MTQPTTRLSTSSDNDERFRRASIISSLPLLANAPSIQKLSLKHLSTIDSKRFMRVLDNTVTRVLIVSSFPRIISNVKEYSLLIGRNATVLFEKYGPLSRTYDEQCSMLKQPPRYTDREATEQHRQSLVSFDEGFSVNSDFPQTTGKVKPNIAARLFELTRMILRELLNNPLAISAMIRHREKWDIEPSPSCRRLAIQLVHLRSLTRNDLLTTPKARARRDDFLERLRRRDLEQRRMIDELTGQYEVLQKTQKTQNKPTFKHSLLETQECASGRAICRLEHHNIAGSDSILSDFSLNDGSLVIHKIGLSKAGMGISSAFRCTNSAPKVNLKN